MNCANAGKEKQQKELLEEKTALKRPSLDLTLLIAVRREATRHAALDFPRRRTQEVAVKVTQCLSETQNARRLQDYPILI